jgi:hypothetical protein
MKSGLERRGKQRFVLTLTVHFRVSVKGFKSRWGTGTVHDMSSGGLSFRSRRQLPMGGHLELIIDWPNNNNRRQYPIHLHATGFVVRHSGTKTAVRITSHRFRIENEAAAPMGELA